MKTILFSLLFLPSFLFAQTIDTLTFHSEAFDQERSEIAVVDLEYKLKETPGTVGEEMKKIEEVSKVGSA